MLASLQYHNSLFPVQWWGGNLKTVQCKVKPFCGWVWKCVSSCKVTDWCDGFLFVMPGLQAEQSHTKITQKVTQSTKGLDLKNIKRRFKKTNKNKKQCVHYGLPDGAISSLETLVVFQITSFHLCNSLWLLISTCVALPPMTHCCSVRTRSDKRLFLATFTSVLTLLQLLLLL